MHSRNTLLYSYFDGGVYMYIWNKPRILSCWDHNGWFMSSSFLLIGLLGFELSNKFHKGKKTKSRVIWHCCIYLAFTLNSCLPLKHSIFVEMMWAFCFVDVVHYLMYQMNVVSGGIIITQHISRVSCLYNQVLHHYTRKQSECCLKDSTIGRKKNSQSVFKKNSQDQSKPKYTDNICSMMQGKSSSLILACSLLKQIL